MIILVSSLLPISKLVPSILTRVSPLIGPNVGLTDLIRVRNWKWVLLTAVLG